MDATLYGLELSHPSHSVRLMLEHKGIEHRVVNIPPGSQPIALRAFGFRGSTVPALKIHGRRLQRSRFISRELDRIEPGRPLFPTDAAARAAVEEAERWGDEVYQAVPRRIVRFSLTRDRALRTYFGEEMGLPAPSVTGEMVKPLAGYFARAVGANEESVAKDLGDLPAHLDHVDGLIAGGVIGGDEPNAADFQIATTTAVLLRMPTLRPLIEGRPAATHAGAVATGIDTGLIPLDLPLS